DSFCLISLPSDTVQILTRKTEIHLSRKSVKNCTANILPVIPSGVLARSWTRMEDPEDVTPPNSAALISALTIVPGTVITAAAGRIHAFFTDIFRNTHPLTNPVIIPTGAKYRE